MGARPRRISLLVGSLLGVGLIADAVIDDALLRVGLFANAVIGGSNVVFDAADRRWVYDHFPVFPGASEADAERYEIMSDSGGTGHFGLRVTYELPSDAVADDVIGYYRAQIPAGWMVADDQTCRSLIEWGATPPTMVGAEITEPSAEKDDLVLMFTESHLSVFAPGGSPFDGGADSGVTFALHRVGEAKYLIADQPDFACGPSEPDRFALEFDAPTSS